MTGHGINSREYSFGKQSRDAGKEPMFEENELGLLPTGIHDASMDDIRARFGSFQRTARRMRLCDQLNEFISELRRSEITGYLVIDGSFVMTCVDEPSDIDLVLVLDSQWNFEEDLRPFQYNLVSHRQIKKRFQFDVKVAPEGTIAMTNAIEFFQKVNPKWCEPHSIPLGTEKGLLKVAL